MYCFVSSSTEDFTHIKFTDITSAFNPIPIFVWLFVGEQYLLQSMQLCRYLAQIVNYLLALTKKLNVEFMQL